MTGAVALSTVYKAYSNSASSPANSKADLHLLELLQLFMISFIAQLTSAIFAHLCEILFAFVVILRSGRTTMEQFPFGKVIYRQFELNDLATMHRQK